MIGDEPMVRHHVHFTAAYQRGTVIPVQYGTECQNGYIQPVPRLLNITPEKDLCIEHRKDPIGCFAELATEKVLKAYHSIEHYQVGLLLAMNELSYFHCFILFYKFSKLVQDPHI